MELFLIGYTTIALKGSNPYIQMQRKHSAETDTCEHLNSWNLILPKLLRQVDTFVNVDMTDFIVVLQEGEDLYVQ